MAIPSGDAVCPCMIALAGKKRVGDGVLGAEPRLSRKVVRGNDCRIRAKTGIGLEETEEGGFKGGIRALSARRFGSAI